MTSGWRNQSNFEVLSDHMGFFVQWMWTYTFIVYVYEHVSPQPVLGSVLRRCALYSGGPGSNPIKRLISLDLVISEDFKIW